MKNAIVYYSKHHENTKALIDAIAEKYDVDCIDITEHPSPDLTPMTVSDSHLGFIIPNSINPCSVSPRKACRRA